MDDDRDAVGRRADVELDPVAAGNVERSAQGRQAVLGSATPVAPVGKPERPVRLGVRGQAQPLVIGRANEKVDPLPSSDSTQIRPPCWSTTCLAIASPSPVPPPRTRARSTL